ncbi:DEAD/DEAH box helicase [Psychrobacillus psychrodurans]|uniref:DEAD/DEAH box helicase n=1 Tax=Psychrobacillus psychrodurans TaxID=126157 RepID=UPI0008E8B6D8|nr:AAA domain-containing protein [Psychrobacillus psychrodurans]MCZ8538726.1 AAA domain-containing protein [Psychrobacillus psychrodurans]SFM20683.1 Superfamily I DNA and/or RNA helicase [Psychrobacillus psychrodurans]
MSQSATLVKTMRCNLMITNKARKGIQEWSTDEHAFFNIQNSFEVYIEKRPVNNHGNTSLSIYFDNVTNVKLAEKVDSRVVVMECILQKDGLLATGLHVRGPKVPVRTNRRLAVDLDFVTTRNNGAGMPLVLHTKIQDLPVAEERSEYVKKRISSWEGYLKIQERNADIADIASPYSKLAFNADFSRMTLHGCTMNANEWKNLRGLSVTLKGFQNDVGDILKADRAKQTIEVEIKPKFRELARKNQWNPKSKEVVFSNFASLSQIRRLRKGFEDLQNGLAANPNLEKILFEDRPTIRVNAKRRELEFHNQLNEFQQEAVVGAMSAEDLYVIQGPPGTGKTTVISEICQQNAKAGLRTLVASQSNLAVDNALSRLLSNKEIRILRFGRTESIEEEGKRFIEENVGLYWKEQTLISLKKELDEHSLREGQLLEQIAGCECRIEELSKEQILIKKAIEQKAEAKVEHEVRLEEIKQLKKQIVLLKKDREELEISLYDVRVKSEALAHELETMDRFIQTNPTREELNSEIDQFMVKIKDIQNYILYKETIDSLQQTEINVETYREKYQEVLVKLNHLEMLKSDIDSIRKVDQLKSKMNEYEIECSSQLQFQMTELDELIGKILAFTDWQELNSRLFAAIDYVEKLLQKYKFPFENVKNNMGRSGILFDSEYTVKEIHQFMNRMKHIMTADDELTTEKLAILLEGLYVREKFVIKQKSTVQMAKNSSITKFQSIKSQVLSDTNREMMSLQHLKTELANKAINEKNQLDFLQKTVKQLEIEIDTTKLLSTSAELKDKKLEMESSIVALKKTEETVTSYMEQLEMKKRDLQKVTKELEEKEAVLQDNELKTKQVNADGLEQERILKALDEILLQNPEQALENTVEAIKGTKGEMVKLQLEKDHLPITQAVQNEWYLLLKEANDHDLDEIRKLYVRHANVIGTTCVASARKEFMENYPVFDVVIIDEVSKATPPELLLPMLKGKKIILVGDHHQLPPLVGEDTLDETLQAILEESDNLEEKDELKKLLKESLFERLFKNLPKTSKTMLAIQYRMHESIMETITPFYEEENYRLQCGLADSDTARDHLLESRYVKRKDHLLWLDMPSEKPYFEERMKDGKSRFNQAELDAIRDVLIDLNDATANAKKEGRMDPDERKSIGVISFYGEQVKRIDRLIGQQANLSHLTFRTGTVDKFQGMEMDVILLSMVRNNQEKSGDIGFANDYRRLNVALSRARELLILVGSSHMFTKRAKQRTSREMYERLLQIVKGNNGLINFQKDGNK